MYPSAKSDESKQSMQYTPPPANPDPPPTYQMPPPTHHTLPPTTTKVTIADPSVTIQPSLEPGHLTTATIVMNPSMGMKPAQHTCPSCRKMIVTKVEKDITTKTHIVAILLCAAFLWPCVWIPYCVDSCKTINHYCPNCNAYIGSYKH